MTGVELVEDGAYLRTVRLRDNSGGEVLGWLSVRDDAQRDCLQLSMSESLLPVRSQAITCLKGGRAAVTIYCSEYKCPQLGNLTLASDGEALIGLWLNGQKYFAQGYPDMQRDNALEAFKPAFAWLGEYLAGADPAVDTLNLEPRGTVFQQRVWQKLLEIPLGQLRTYGDIGKQLAAEDDKNTFSAQAVGGAVGHNPISIIIPCHRVVGSNGSLTGYAGGISKKVWLLEHEGAMSDELFIPKKGTAL